MEHAKGFEVRPVSHSANCCAYLTPDGRLSRSTPPHLASTSLAQEHSGHGRLAASNIVFRIVRYCWEHAKPRNTHRHHRGSSAAARYQP
jgi:hypothetical protein